MVTKSRRYMHAAMMMQFLSHALSTECACHVSGSVPLALGWGLKCSVSAKWCPTVFANNRRTIVDVSMILSQSDFILLHPF